VGLLVGWACQAVKSYRGLPMPTSQSVVTKFGQFWNAANDESGVISSI
jgi:hypothetical protein